VAGHGHCNGCSERRAAPPYISLVPPPEKVAKWLRGLAMAYCLNCDHELSLSAAWCPKCGNRGDGLFAPQRHPPSDLPKEAGLWRTYEHIVEVLGNDDWEPGDAALWWCAKLGAIGGALIGLVGGFQTHNVGNVVLAVIVGIILGFPAGMIAFNILRHALRWLLILIPIGIGLAIFVSLFYLKF
jgi:hypothetical protein